MIGASGKSYSIEVSADLVTWVPLGTFKADTLGNVVATDSAGANQPQRFYRAIEK